MSEELTERLLGGRTYSSRELGFTLEQRAELRRVVEEIITELIQEGPARELIEHLVMETLERSANQVLDDALVTRKEKEKVRVKKREVPKELKVWMHTYVCRNLLVANVSTTSALFISACCSCWVAVRRRRQGIRKSRHITTYLTR